MIISNFERIVDSLFLAFIFVFPIFIIKLAIRQYKKGYNYKEKLMSKIIKEGHMVTATLKKGKGPINNVPGTNNRYSRYLIYEFKWKGKLYKYRTWEDWNHKSDSTIKLYFFNNPRKAKPEQYYMYSEKFPWLLFFLIAILFYVV